MTELTMKDYSGFIVEKPFSCDVEGCSMKFTNEDHLTVHKKRHDMVLNLGLGPKGNIFADQTPTPTSFIRNCEEVGLFQDLQNVNPFEETFKKAAEAVKTGQTPCLDRPFQSNPPDDTLHTPNVFPLTDLTCIPHAESCTPSENLPNRDISLKPEPVESIIQTPIIEKDPPVTTEEEVGNSHKKRKNDLEEPIVLQVPNGHFVQLVTPDKLPSETPFNMVILNSQDSVKDKIRKSINEKTTTTELLPLKVPIPKIPVNNNNSTDKFATFTKNSLKLMEKPKSGIFDLTAKKRKKKQTYFVQQESRSEFLARNRAAATRCREKKKVYIWNLENLNRDLTLNNQNLQLLNMELKGQILDLQKELLRHKSCNATNSATEALISKIPSNIREEKVAQVKKVSKEEKNTVQIGNNKDLINDTVMFDIVEVTLNENEEESVPLIEKTAQDIINLNNNNDNTKNDLSNEFPTNHLLFKNLDNLGQSFKQVYNEHCYFAKEITIDVDKGMFNCRSKVLAPDLVCKNSDGDVNKVTSSSVLLNSKTPPPLILLKPFKKRNLLSESKEKS